MDWAEKYRPATLGDIVGNTAAVRQIIDWAKNWTRTSKPLLLYGKPGIGKTSSAYALGNDMGWEVIELNASDQRTAGVIERVAGVGSTTASLTGSSRKLIVIDEADNLQGTSDRGGAKAIVDCIKHAQQPIILIANDLYGISPEIRTRTEPVQFRALPARSIAPRLKYLCSAEKITCTDAAIHAIADSAEGDVRSAVNMLYASAIGRDLIDDAQVHTSQKDERISIFSLIPAVFSKISDEDLMRISREVEDTPESIEQWIEGSLSLLGDQELISHAYRNLARADEYLGYTYRRQYHTLWRYATAIMLLGVADAAGGRGIHARITSPERWQKMASARKQKAIRVALLNKIAGVMNIPQSTLREKYLGTLSMIIENNPLEYTRELGFDADQLNFFLNDKVKSQEIMKVMQQEEKAKEKERDTEKKKLKKEKPIREIVKLQPRQEPQPHPEKEPQQEPEKESRQEPEKESRQVPKPPANQPGPEPAEPPVKKSQAPAQSSFDMF